MLKMTSLSSSLDTCTPAWIFFVLTCSGTIVIDTRPNGDALRKCVLQGPYIPSTVTIPAEPATDDSQEVPERTAVETLLNMSLEKKEHYQSEKEAIHLLLTGIGDEIYSTVDTCKIAHDMWIAIERLQQGESLNIQDVKTNLFWEFGKFTSHDGDSMESYYSRFYKMMNEMCVGQKSIVPPDKSSAARQSPLLKDRLNEDRRTLFKIACFGPWLDIIYVENDDGMIHYVLQKQCCSDNDNFDLPLIYHVNGHSLHFGHREFCLLTGFEFGSISFREYRNGDIPFRNRLFPEKIGYDVKIIGLFALFDDEEKFSKLSDADSIRLCLMVNDLDAWNSFPWGKHIWRQLYASIRNVSSKHKLEHLAGLKRNPNHVPSYSLTGFLFYFQDRWWTKVSEIIPRALSWRRKAEFNQYEYFGELFRKAPIELASTKDEVQCNWYAPSNDYFMWYVPRSPPVSIGGLYGEYMNKRSAARAAKKKSSKDFHPSECVREASLIDRVRELECICETLLTIPKEVKSLRGRIHKLESIIQSTFYPSRVVEK
ncbi:hypothetical protein Tco_0390093 [Tanacetum coccineum]